MKNFKLALVCAFVGACSVLPALPGLNMFINTNRFLDPAQKTIVHLDYQIPYADLVFQAIKGGYFAEVNLTVDVLSGDQLLFQQSIQDNIGISNKDDARSTKKYLNRVSFLLDAKDYRIRLKARDMNSQKTFEQTLSVSGLDPSTNLSDLELSSIVRPDSSSFREKFHRGKILYETNPSMIFDKDTSESITLYFEVYSDADLRAEGGLLVLSVTSDSLLIMDKVIDVALQSDSQGLTLKIPIADLKSGRYDATLELQLGVNLLVRDFTFFVTEPRQERYFVLPSADDDYQLLRYFLGTNMTSDWKNFDAEQKSRYITLTWKSWAAANNMQTQTMTELIRERVDYANKYFSHFTPGWTSDMGRIHIRNGKPDEIEKDTSSDDTRYVRKDYQIWKYRGKFKGVYLFVDIQMNGNYKLIFVNNDDRESSYPDYLRYLGRDFDKTLLEN